MEKLPRRFPDERLCANCMHGKCQRNNAPGARNKAKNPLEQVNWDLVMLNDISIEGYRYAAIFTDSQSAYIWTYGLKAKTQ